MVAEEQKFTNTTLFRYRAGLALIWVGVLAWLPFIVMRVGGLRPSFLWFLPFHLTGVIGGSRLRKTARLEMGDEAPKKNAFLALGRSLIFLAICVWGVYFYIKLVMSQPVEMDDFLPYHLTGIFGGLACLGIGVLANRKNTR